MKTLQNSKSKMKLFYLLFLPFEGTKSQQSDLKALIIRPYNATDPA